MNAGGAAACRASGQFPRPSCRCVEDACLGRGVHVDREAGSIENLGRSRVWVDREAGLVEKLREKLLAVAFEGYGRTVAPKRRPIGPHRCGSVSAAAAKKAGYRDSYVVNHSGIRFLHLRDSVRGLDKRGEDVLTHSEQEGSDNMHYLIDIVGTCNLRCPSCPVGNFKASDFLEKTRDKGFMDIELFRKIIDKIINESQRYGEDFSILLYNWGEAMLHPKIDEFANILQKLSIPFHMSSNLNTEAKFTQIVRAAATFRISVSGYSNETYQKGHVAGDINLVISNMYRTRYEIDRCKSAIQVSVFYHVYKDNCDEKMINLARLSRDLGFQFGIGLAYFMPLEKVLAYTEKSPSFTENDRNTMDRMDLPRFRGELGACVQSI